MDAGSSVIRVDIADGVVVAVAIAIMLGKMLWRWRTQRVNTVHACGADLLNGAVVVPFFLMVIDVFNFLDVTLRPSALAIALAGVIGLIFVVGELSRT